ncbi:hypothetical protein NUW58_g1709 [Xylaria curta]|uniref:Uncharacterized protein n=1 Tax=Xylaria curta TaxID=42375 RepID=A0ACC1PLQ8_9PEZI|nr:hypothetical protein NUW58_g1709 [Xylaria curta]
MPTTFVQLAGLQTESRNTQTINIDRVSTLELCRILNWEDRKVPRVVEQCIPVIAGVIDTLSDRVRNGGRVFYIGAGTSGRLGVLDASEIPPTYSAPFGQFIALIAGGDDALRQAKEGAEDDRDGAKVDLQEFNLDPKVDSLIGIASSGRTPYVLGGLSYAKSLGATTVALVCVSSSAAKSEGNADYLIPAVAGPEAITGSTRMKAGTATKLILNMISTGIMVKLGKTYGNLMVDVKATNVKLQQRARNILRLVGGDACTQSDIELDEILASCCGSVKLAAAVIVLKIPVQEAEDRLQRNKGVLARVFDEGREKETQQERSSDNNLVLCVDAGGTSCTAVVMSEDGETGVGLAGPCNVTSVGLNSAVSTISIAIQGAVDNWKTITGCQMNTIKPSVAWVGMAGYGRPSVSSMIDDSLSELLSISLGPKLKITTDTDLLISSMANQTSLDHVIVLVAGTGSVAMSYARANGQFERTHRVGGWGHLLGDDGSGYSIGREALRTALYSSELYGIHVSEDPDITARKLPPLSQAIIEYFKELYPGSKSHDLLSTILVPDSDCHEAEHATLATTKRISSVAKLVLSMAESDRDAKRIVNGGVSSLVDLVTLIVHARCIDTTMSGLVLAGGMMRDDLYRNALLKALEAKCVRFKQIQSVSEPALLGARYLLSRKV